MKSWTLAIAAALLVASMTNALPVPEESPSSSEDSKVPSGVANSLTQGTKAIVDGKTNLLKGLTGVVPSSLQADASSTNEAVQRNERGSAASGFGGYPSPSYGPNTVAETPNNFVNVFSQAAANTVNFGTQLLNSLVGVAANILQGTVSTLLSLLNAKGQVVGAVVQSAPPVLASVTRTAGDVLAAKARIFGAVTQSAVNFGSQLARTISDVFSGLFNGPNAINFNALTGGGRDGGGSPLGSLGGGAGQLLGGVGNFAQTLINAKLNLLNGLLSPFTGGRPLINFGGSGGSSSYGPGSSPSEPNFRITIAASTPSSISLSSPSDSSSGPQFRPPRYFGGNDFTTRAPVLENSLNGLNPANLFATFGGGIVKGLFDQFTNNANKPDNNPLGGQNIFSRSFDNNRAFSSNIFQPATTTTPAPIFPFNLLPQPQPLRAKVPVNPTRAPEQQPLILAENLSNSAEIMQQLDTILARILPALAQQ